MHGAASDVPQAPPGEDELPFEDGVPMETPKHRKQMNVLIEALEFAWSARDDFFVGGNMFLYFSELQTKKNEFRGPDFFVVLGTSRRARKSWVVWQENGQAPDVVIELLSESTRAEDLGLKKDVYARLLKVAYYYAFDPESGELFGFVLSPGRREYEPLAPNAHGRMPCPPLELELGSHERVYQGLGGPWLRWYTPRGELLRIGDELAAAERERAEVERQRAEAERQRAEDLARRLGEYEARFGKLPDS